MRFAIFPLHLSKVLHLPRKITFPKLKIWCSKMQPFWGNQRPDLLTSLTNMSLVLRLPREMYLCRSSSNVPRLPSFLEMLQNLQVLLTFGKVQNPLRLKGETTSEPSKVVRACGAFNILTWKCASRHNGVQLFISHLTTWLRTRRFSEPTFRIDPPEPRTIWKNAMFRDFATFSCTLHLLFSDSFSSLIFFLLVFSSLTLPTSAFHLSILSEVWLLNFLRSNNYPYIIIYI